MSGEGRYLPQAPKEAPRDTLQRVIERMGAGARQGQALWADLTAVKDPTIYAMAPPPRSKPPYHPFEAEEWSEPSDWITHGTYQASDEKNQGGELVGDLTLNLRGREYVYHRVPESVWKGLKAADDRGESYNIDIKGVYDHD